MDFKTSQSIILASASPRRKELLASANINFSVEIPRCDESVLQGEGPREMVLRLSMLKAQAVAQQHQESWVLAADTTVYINNEILGKPADAQEAFEMLKKISGQKHEVWGGIALVSLDRKIAINEAHSTRVLMRELTDNEIKNFISTGEPMDKAGAYAIQGIGAGLVSEIEGSYTNVVGLNLSAVIELLKKNNVLQ